MIRGEARRGAQFNSKGVSLEQECCYPVTSVSIVDRGPTFWVTTRVFMDFSSFLEAARSFAFLPVLLTYSDPIPAHTSLTTMSTFHVALRVSM